MAGASLFPGSDPLVAHQAGVSEVRAQVPSWLLSPCPAPRTKAHGRSAGRLPVNMDMGEGVDECPEIRGFSG